MMRTLLLATAAWFSIGAAAVDPLYTEGDFAKIRKFDAHVHANRDDPTFLAVARKDGFELLSINVDYPDFPPLALQASVAHVARAADPVRFHYATTFTMKGFGAPGWTETTIRALDAAFADGAVAVKVWKNIGMVERDAAGKRVFIDDPRFDGVMPEFSMILDSSPVKATIPSTHSVFLKVQPRSSKLLIPTGSAISVAGASAFLASYCCHRTTPE